MPRRRPGLVVVARKGTATLYLRGTVRGHSVFESAGTSDPERAEALRAKREAELWDRSVFGARAVVTFAHAVESYLTERPPTPGTARYVGKLLDHFGAQQLHRIDQEAVDRAYRVLLTLKAGPATRQRAVLTPLRAILEHAAVRGWCPRPAFIGQRVAKAQTPFFRPAEASALVKAAAPHLRPLLVFLFATGCRLGEGLALDWEAVDLHGARVVVKQKQGTHRQVDLPPVAVAALAALPHRDGRVFRPVQRGRIGAGYRPSGVDGGGQIKTAFRTALRRAGLEGRKLTPHSTRHSWATWHYCNFRDMRRLMEDGGWATFSMVVRYTKLLPDAYRGEVEAWWQGGPGIAAVAA